MAFCSNCGTQIEEGVKFCPSCGTVQEGQTATPITNIQPSYTTSDDASDIQANKILALLSYFWLLFLVPWFLAPNSRFARFHAKQGINYSSWI